jgi:hypothetical protein
VKVTLKDGETFENVTALKRRPAALYFVDAAGAAKAVPEDEVQMIEPAPTAEHPIERLPITPSA